jgi:hypothetical protein
VAQPETVPPELEVNARTADGATGGPAPPSCPFTAYSFIPKASDRHGHAILRTFLALAQVGGRMTADLQRSRS